MSMAHRSSLRTPPDLRAQLLWPVHGAHGSHGHAASGGAGSFAQDLHRALRERPRSISPKYFYDTAGSVLFDRICELPEYYPTRTELDLLARHAPDIARCIGPGVDLIEYGAGSTRKVRLLLDTLPQPHRFVPIDISADHLHAAATRLRHDYPGLDVVPLAADFTQPFDLPAAPRAGRAGFFPGSSIGNFTPAQALDFLQMTASQLRGGGLLIGVDLVKDPAVLHAAYNDSQGVTAAFNRNLLVRANRELGTNFEVDRFAHYAFYEPRLQRIEMHLVSTCRQEVMLDGQTYAFDEGEALHTENSCKYTVAGFQALAARAGYVPAAVWCDPQGWFSLHWLSLPA